MVKLEEAEKENPICAREQLSIEHWQRKTFETGFETLRLELNI